MAEHPFDRFTFARLDTIRKELQHYVGVAQRKMDTAPEELREKAAEAVEDAQAALERIEIYLRKDKTNG